ncbi:MAG: WYL domain-containing protein [Microlunatus sp.]|nr:WYL domain-containing protein [Microlunatus sp.]
MTGRRSSGQTAQAQVRRLLSLIPYLRKHDGAAITDVAEAFGVPTQRIREDLNVLWMCGLPGLSPGDLIDIDMDAVDGEGVIHLSNADYLTRPLRLTADEALALILALRTLRGVTATGDRDAIDRALTKLEAVAGERPELVAGQAQVAVTGGREDILATVTEALRRGKRLELTYDVASRAETTHRYVDPLRVFVLDGYGYLDAWCYSADGLRSFRLDRIASITMTETDVDEHQVRLRDTSLGWFDAWEDAPLVTLALDRPATWVAEYYPMESVTPAADGGLTVTTRVSDPAWLRGLLLRLGGGARVLSPEGAGDSAADAALEALDQYAALAGS